MCFCFVFLEATPAAPAEPASTTTEATPMETDPSPAPGTGIPNAVATEPTSSTPTEEPKEKTNGVTAGDAEAKALDNGPAAAANGAIGEEPMDTTEKKIDTSGGLGGKIQD